MRSVKERWLLVGEQAEICDEAVDLGGIILGTIFVAAADSTANRQIAQQCSFQLRTLEKDLDRWPSGQVDR